MCNSEPEKEPLSSRTPQYSLFSSVYLILFLTLLYGWFVHIENWAMTHQNTKKTFYWYVSANFPSSWSWLWVIVWSAYRSFSFKHVFFWGDLSHDGNYHKLPSISCKAYLKCSHSNELYLSGTFSRVAVPFSVNMAITNSKTWTKTSVANMHWIKG